MILLFGNIVDAWVIKTEISEMKLSIGAVGVRLFVPMWINMSCGCSSFGLISSCKTVRTCVIVGDLLKVKSCPGGKNQCSIAVRGLSLQEVYRGQDS